MDAPADPSPSDAPDPTGRSDADDGGFDLEKVLSTLAGLAGALTAVVAFLRARRPASYARTSPARPVAVVGATTPEPAKWKGAARPEHWESEETRKRYWKKRRRAYWLGYGAAWVVVFGGVWIYAFDAAGLGLFGLIYALLAIPYAISALVQVSSLGKEPWKPLSLRMKEARVIVEGDRDEVMRRCVDSLYAVGASLTKFDSDLGTIEAATGPETWWYTPEKIEVSVAAAGSDRYEISVVSDDVAALPDEFFKRNLTNVRRMVAELTTAPAAPKQDGDV